MKITRTCCIIDTEIQNSTTASIFLSERRNNYFDKYVLYFNTFSNFITKNQKGTNMNGDTTRYRIKSRLALLGITQTQLLDEMAKRGFRVSHSNFSTSLRAKGISEVQERYLEEADKILREMESK